MTTQHPSKVGHPQLPHDGWLASFRIDPTLMRAFVWDRAPQNPTTGPLTSGRPVLPAIARGATAPFSPATTRCHRSTSVRRWADFGRSGHIRCPR
jgi:hypothetical protein